jgi:hypothetical protein
MLGNASNATWKDALLILIAAVVVKFLFSQGKK